MRKENIIRFLVCIGINLFLSSSFGQIVSMDYFNDGGSGNLDRIFDYHEVEDGIIISGLIILPTTQEPVILKLNTSGDVVWSTFNTTRLGTPGCGSFRIDAFEDGYIYGTSTNYVLFSYFEKTMWKVDMQTGEVTWTNLLVNSQDNGIVEMAEYDSTRFVLAYKNTLHTVFCMADKTTGNILSSDSLINGPSAGFGPYWDPNLGVDQNKNIYYSQAGRITKFNQTDFNQVIWQKDHLRQIIEIYIDRYDDLYLIGGRNFQGGTTLFMKVDNSTGDNLWEAEFASNLGLRDYVDFNNSLYGTFQHLTTGSGAYRFKTMKIDKITGLIEWLSSEDHNTLGTPVPFQSSIEQSALSIDVDCNGNPFLTGYYGDANFGPEAWGTMKLDDGTGTRIYDLTITNDSLNYDDISTGIAVCVFQNTPIILGHLEISVGQYSPMFVKLDGATGNILIRKPIGGFYQYPSNTIDIINKDNYIYTLKQIGKKVVVEQYDTNFNFNWSRTIADTNMLVGGQIHITNNYVYLSLSKKENSSLPPYYSNQTEKIEVYKLDKVNGSISLQDSINFSPNNAYPFEIEGDDNAAYIFYYDNGSTFYRKWNAGGISSANLFDIAGNNITDAHELDLILDYNLDSLVVIGNSDIYIIDKSSLVKSSAYNFSFPREYFDILRGNGNALLMSGNNGLNQQLFTSFDLSSMSIDWEQTYESNGTMYKSEADSAGNYFVLGDKNGHASVTYIEPISGLPYWTYYVDSIDYPQTMPYDISVEVSKKYVSLALANINSNSTSDALIQLINYQGDTIFTYLGQDELFGKSRANTLLNMADSSVLVGGSLNRIDFSKEGFIYNIVCQSVGVPLQITTIEEGENLKIFPNPAKEKINVLSRNKINRIDIFNLTGQIQITKIEQFNEISISSLISGLYFIRIETVSGVVTKKFIKH